LRSDRRKSVNRRLALSKLSDLEAELPKSVGPDPLPQRFFLVPPINVAELGQARVARCERDQLAAGRGLSVTRPHEHAGECAGEA
jgi:hypothetical protein